MTLLKLHWHLHACCSRNGTQSVVARHAISVVRSVTWSVCLSCLRAVYASVTHSSRNARTKWPQYSRNGTTCLRIHVAYFSLSLHTSTHCPDDFAHACICRGIFGTFPTLQHNIYIALVSQLDSLWMIKHAEYQRQCCCRTEKVPTAAAGLLHLEEQEKRQQEQQEEHEKETERKQGQCELGDGWLEDSSTDNLIDRTIRYDTIRYDTTV